MSDDTFRLYNCRDAKATRLVSSGLRKELGELGALDFYFTVVQPLAPVLVQMNLKGLRVNQEKREEAMLTLEKEVEREKEELEEILGFPLEVRGDRLGTFLFEELKLAGGKRTRKGKWFQDEEILKDVVSKNPEIGPVCDLILGVRRKEKLVSTYLEPAQWVDKRGRLCSNFKIGPVTGRLASIKPNFQNVPEGLCRSIYEAAPGYLFIAADYSQVELRIFALLSKAEALLEAFRAGKDIHSFNARALLGKGEEEAVDKRERDFAKIFMYGLLYGAEVERLHQSVSRVFTSVTQRLSLKNVQDAYNRFFTLFPQARSFRAGLVAKVRKERKLIGPFGRPRFFFGNEADIVTQAGNFPMQNGAADLIAKAMIRIAQRLPDTLVLQVHDSVMIEVREEEVEEKGRVLKEILEEPVPEFDGYSFPSTVKVGKNWSEV